jgi:hypothetical protein
MLIGETRTSTITAICGVGNPAYRKTGSLAEFSFPISGRSLNTDRYCSSERGPANRSRISLEVLAIVNRLVVVLRRPF